MTAECLDTPLYPRAVKPQPYSLPLGRFLVEYVRNPLRVMTEKVYEEPLVRWQRGNVNSALVLSPALIEDILIKHTEDFTRSNLEKRVFRHNLGDGVLTSEGNTWRWQRRILAPLFRHSEIETYAPIMAQVGLEQIAKWRASGKISQDIDRDMTEATFAIIARTMLVGGEPAEAETIKHETERFLSRIGWEIAFSILGLPEWMPHPGFWRMRSSSRALRNAIHTIIQRRKSENLPVAAAGGDLLGRLLAARDPETGEPMDEAHLIDNLLTLLEAGHETTSRALAWTLYLLARAPEWQSRVRAEILDVAGNSSIGAEHMSRLPITQQVLKEALRLYPPAPMLVRTFKEKTVLHDMIFEAGDLAVIPIFCLHRHRKLWDDPDRFDPTRFTPEKEKTYARTQYMPFGAGPRICMGQGFAMMEATILLASFVREMQFDWTGQHEPEPVSRITLRPSNGLQLDVRPVG